MRLKLQWLKTKLILLITWLSIQVKVRYLYWFVDHDEWKYEGDLDKASRILRKFRGVKEDEPEES